MKVNHKQLFLGLRQQQKALLAQLQPAGTADKVNEIPENFNQVGWDTTIEKMEQLLEKMKELRANKGKRLTPQFYRSIYNRCIIAIGESDKLLETLTVDDDSIDYETESFKLMAEISKLKEQVAKVEAEKAKTEQQEQQEPTE
jgi:phage shock protein A